MVMLDDSHLHIDERDTLADWLSKTLSAARSGMITVNVADEPAVKITANNGEIAVNLLQPNIFKVPQDETRLLDKLKTASEFGSKLSESDVTLSIMRKDKEVVVLGKGAKPTLSKLVTRSDDVQMSSVREFGKLKGEFKTD